MHFSNDSHISYTSTVLSLKQQTTLKNLGMSQLTRVGSEKWFSFG